MAGDVLFFRDLAYVFVAAVLGGTAAWATRQPLILGYVLGGILIGPFTPGPSVSDLHTFELFAEIGVVLLMFSIGVEFSLRDLSARSRAWPFSAAPRHLALHRPRHGDGRRHGLAPAAGAIVGIVVSVASTMVLARLLIGFRPAPVAARPHHDRDHARGRPGGGGAHRPHPDLRVRRRAARLGRSRAPSGSPPSSWCRSSISPHKIVPPILTYVARTRSEELLPPRDPRPRPRHGGGDAGRGPLPGPGSVPRRPAHQRVGLCPRIAVPACWASATSSWPSSS